MIGDAESAGGPDSPTVSAPLYTARGVETTAADPRSDSELQLPPGEMIADRYRLVRRIGKGGMGSVWEALHVALDAPVAIKFINPELVHHEGARARFLQEARAAAQLRDSHVVQVFDHGVHAGTPYIAMEMLRGESLGTRLRRDGRLSPSETLAIFTDVVAAIGKAHAMGLVHRDLKPDNIFLVEESSGGGPVRQIAKVLDFGIAKALAPSGDSTRTGSGVVLGTPVYMSPEQLADSSVVDHRADLWSLGVIAYECVVGERPFAAGNVAELAIRLYAHPPPTPSRHAAVPRGFDAWFARATASDQERRFQSATELLGALAPALATAPVARRSLPAVVWVAGVVAACLVTLGVAATLRGEAAPEAATRPEPAPPRDGDGDADASAKAATPGPAATRPEPAPPRDGDGGADASANAATPDPVATPARDDPSPSPVDVGPPSPGPVKAAQPVEAGPEPPARKASPGRRTNPSRKRPEAPADVFDPEEVEY